jgi:tetratricopeptide (TPR) repeat protein
LKPVTLSAAFVLALLFGSAGVAAQDTSLDEARSLIRQGRPDAAIELLDRYLSTASEDPQARFLRGVAFAESDRRQEAIDVFSALVTDFPNLPEPYNNLAVLYASEGELDEALFTLFEAIRIHPSYATAHENLGDVYATLAKREYAAATDLDRTSNSARVKHAKLNELAGLAAAKPSGESALEIAADTSAAAADIHEGVLTAVTNWADAWSRQDVNAYLSHYAAEFVPADGKRRQHWVRLRRKRVAAPQFIRVEISTPKVEFSSDSRATVTFKQSYRSETYEDYVTKRLDLLRKDQTWKILGERTVN